MAQATSDHISTQKHFPHMRTARVSAKADDTQLLELGRQAEKLEAWMDGHQDSGGDAKWARVMSQHGKLLGRIIALPAFTLEGMRVKAARIAHWHVGVGEEMCDGDQVLALSLVRDLLPATNF